MPKRAGLLGCHFRPEPHTGAPMTSEQADGTCYWLLPRFGGQTGADPNAVNIMALDAGLLCFS